VETNERSLELMQIFSDRSYFFKEYPEFVYVKGDIKAKEREKYV